MFGWFKKKPDGSDQIQDFISRLEKCEPSELGLAVATVEHTANVNFIYGDFYNPAALMSKKPEVLTLGLNEALRLQASGLEVMAVGWIVWVHTFRAVNNEKLAPLAKRMWTLLIRGAPFAEDQRATLVPLLGFELNINRPDRVPLGCA